MDFADIDFANFVVDFLSLLVAVVVFWCTSRQEKKAIEKQTQKETIRATLTEFNALRQAHRDFDTWRKNNPQGKPDASLIASYVRDLERFAVGYTSGAYDLATVSKMSGGLLITVYNKYFKDYIAECRNATALDSSVPRSGLYINFEKMMKDLFAMRKEPWTPIKHISDRRWVLEHMLHMPISSADEVFALFRKLPGAVESHGDCKQGYLFVPGTRQDRCVLVAHADTVFDAAYAEPVEQEIVFDDGCYRGVNPACSIGADDRAGCAMLWLLRDSGHSLLLLDGEEHGQIGSHYLRDSNPELFSQLNAHTFMLQLDRQDNHDYKCYELPVSQEFVSFVEKGTGYKLATGKGRTDIQVLCRDVCGVNLSIGYYDQHRPEERLCLEEWEHTLDVVTALIAPPLKRFPLERQEE